MKIISIFTTSLLLSTLLFSSELEKVSIQLSWKYQFEFAGFIVAKEKGFYRDAGLDVELKEYKSDIDIIENVLDGNSTYGIANSTIFVKDKKIAPIILLASYFKQSPLVLVTKPDIKRPNDFKNRNIMSSGVNDLDSGAITLLLNHFGIDSTNANFFKPSFDVDRFINDEIDVIMVFSSNELYELRKESIDFNIIKTSDYGFYSTAVNLFTSRDETINNLERTKKFIEASNRGWQYALDNKSEAIDIIYDKYSKNKTKESLEFEANEIEKLFMRGHYKVGSVEKELAIRLFNQLREIGLIEKKEILKKFTFEDVLKSRYMKLSDLEKKYLIEKGEIKMCIDPNWMPFEMIKDGKHYGIASDYMRIIEAKIDTPIKLVESSSWFESTNLAKDRECDIFSLASNTPERSKYMDFTTGYLSVPLVMVTKTDKIFIDNITTLKDKKIAVVKGYSIAEKLKKTHPYLNIVEVKNVKDGLDRVKSGEIYGYIDNLPTLIREIQINYLGVLKVSLKLNEKVNLAIGTRNDEKLLNSIFEKALYSIDKNVKDEIYKKWISTEHIVKFDYRLLFKILLLLFIAGIFILYHLMKLKDKNAQLYRLNRSLKRKRKELNSLNRNISQKLEKEVEIKLKVVRELQVQKDIVLGQNRMAEAGRIIRAVAHQWKQPLNTISLYASLYSEVVSQTPENENINKELNDIEVGILNQVNFMVKTIDDFRDFFKPTKDIKPFIALESIEKIKVMFQSYYLSSGIIIDVKSDEKFYFLAKENEFLQALLIIINNARDEYVKQERKKAVIECYFEKRDNLGIVKIRDFAGGIPLEYLPLKLFEPYFSTKGDEGTGVGLEIAKSVIETNMGGKLWVHNVENGAEFVMEIPIENINNKIENKND